MNELIFAKGFKCFKKHDRAPEWVIGDIALNIDEFGKWIKDGADGHITEYNGQRQLKLQIKMSKDGRPMIVVNDYKGKKEDENPF